MYETAFVRDAACERMCRSACWTVHNQGHGRTCERADQSLSRKPADRDCRLRVRYAGPMDGGGFRTASRLLWISTGRGRAPNWPGWRSVGVGAADRRRCDRCQACSVSQAPAPSTQSGPKTARYSCPMPRACHGWTRSAGRPTPATFTSVLGCWRNSRQSCRRPPPRRRWPILAALCTALLAVLVYMASADSPADPGGADACRRRRCRGTARHG